MSIRVFLLCARVMLGFVIPSKLLTCMAVAQELELKMDAGSLGQLLDFLKHSFGDGTDVDRPLELSLDRLESKEWAQVHALCRSACGAASALSRGWPS